MDKSQWQISDRLIVLLVIAFGIPFMAVLILPVFSGSRHEKNINAYLDEKALSLSIKNYNQALGVYPTGESSNIVNMLAGNNPQKIIFFCFRRSAEHQNEMVDPWETPYQIQFFQQTNFVIRSAGKDRFFGNADDIVFNSISNDFVKP